MVERCYREVGSQIRVFRQARGMSQQRLADRIGLGRTSIVNIEAGRQRIMLHDIIIFAKVLGARVSMLIRQ